VTLGPVRVMEVGVVKILLAGKVKGTFRRVMEYFHLTYKCYLQPYKVVRLSKKINSEEHGCSEV